MLAISLPKALACLPRPLALFQPASSRPAATSNFTLEMRARARERAAHKLHSRPFAELKLARLLALLALLLLLLLLLLSLLPPLERPGDAPLAIRTDRKRNNKSTTPPFEFPSIRQNIPIGWHLARECRPKSQQIASYIHHYLCAIYLLVFSKGTCDPRVEAAKTNLLAILNQQIKLGYIALRVCE